MSLMFKAHDGREVDFDTLPATSRQGLVNRAIAHVMGNEVASQVVGFIRAQIAEKAGIKTDAVTTDQVKAFRAENLDLLKAKTTEFQNDKLKAIIDGTLGVRAGGGGAAIDPLTREMNKIAMAELQVLLEAHGLKLPRGEDTLSMRGKDLTRGDLIAAHLAKHGEKVEKEAKANLAAAARKAKALVADVSDLADAIGID